MKTEIPEAAIRAGVEAINRASHKIERYIGDDDVRLVQSVLAAAAPHMTQVPAGYVLVPTLPTEQMLEAGRSAVMARDCSGPDWGPLDHYRASGIDHAGIPDRLLEGKGKMSKAWGAELVYCAMIAAAPKPSAQGGWQPIETAPMSEEMKLPNYVLVSNQENGYVFVGYRHEPNYPGDPEWCDEHGEFICPQPTHWQPRPEPPRKEIADENN